MTNFDLDTHIKSHFQLFEGKRTQVEDQKIYTKVYSLCLNEMIAFTSENITTEEIDKLTEKLNSEDTKAVFLEALENVPSVKPRLEARLRYFVDQLLLDSLEKHKNK